MSTMKTEWAIEFTSQITGERTRRPSESREKAEKIMESFGVLGVQDPVLVTREVTDWVPAS